MMYYLRLLKPNFDSKTFHVNFVTIQLIVKPIYFIGFSFSSSTSDSMKMEETKTVAENKAKNRTIFHWLLLSW